jgi:hypothetical protein
LQTLTDQDIDGLTEALDRENRPGLLKGKTAAEQRHIFRELAGRQLLVATIKATSGHELEETAWEEMADLERSAAAWRASLAT